MKTILLIIIGIVIFGTFTATVAGSIASIYITRLGWQVVMIFLNV